MDLGLTGRTVLVTGGYRGTGEGMCHVLGREGAAVVVHGFEPGQADAVATAVGGRAVHGDIRTDAGADEVAAAAGPVDVLVNNYGVAEGHGWFDDDMGVDAWIDMYEKNVLSGVRMVRRLVPAMRERGFGRVLFVSTVGAHRPGARLPHYYAAKQALLSTTVSLAKELGPSGITVNCVSPGIVATAEVRARHGDTPPSTFMPIPAGRMGTPEEVGHLVAFLASPLAGYITGANIRIDGGAADTPN
jgi:NAD(P)-dependent dehydrogenase (short-subunit alcohol dehydrogenase family)